MCVRACVFVCVCVSFSVFACACAPNLLKPHPACCSYPCGTLVGGVVVCVELTIKIIGFVGVGVKHESGLLYVPVPPTRIEQTPVKEKQLQNQVPLLIGWFLASFQS